jgi:lipid II:glycine glycyltransferase (peptidoglycan interpeptide bridge formation enzyme)
VNEIKQQSSIDPSGWNRILAALPRAHILQSWEWGSVKSRHGWQPIFCIWTQQDNHINLQHTLPTERDRIVGAALVLLRTASAIGLNLPLRIMYVPKGPLVLDWADQGLRQKILSDLAEIARRFGAMLIKIDPDVRLGTGLPGSPQEVEDTTGIAVKEELSKMGWVFSDEQVQFRNTVLVDLRPPEDDLMGRMKQKTRYNVRLAARKGVIIRTGEIHELDKLYEMYVETSVRDGFVIRDAGYYKDVWQTFIKAGMAVPIIAEVEGAPVAAVLIFQFAKKCWSLYGMSSKDHRDKMPNYLLQWEAMRIAKSTGCLSYDLWGAPDNFQESDPLWGVYRFKEGFGGEVVRHIGAWDLPVNPVLYRAYTRLLPKILAAMRRRGIARLQQSHGQSVN